MSTQREERLLTEKLTEIRQISSVQLLLYNHYITEEEVQALFNLADAILIPYQRHVGMSGLLVRAAAAKRPVVASDYGLLGALVAKYKLGITLDSTLPAQIAHALQLCIDVNPLPAFDPASALQFAQAHSGAIFAKTISDHLL